MRDDAVLLLAALAVVVGGCAGARGVRLLARGLGHGDDPSAALWIVRGLRGIIVALCLGALAAGAVLGQVWLVVFGALWLAEEVYETGVLALILRAGVPEAREDSPPGG